MKGIGEFGIHAIGEVGWFEPRGIGIQQFEVELHAAVTLSGDVDKLSLIYLGIAVPASLGSYPLFKSEQAAAVLADYALVALIGVNLCCSLQIAVQLYLGKRNFIHNTEFVNGFTMPLFTMCRYRCLSTPFSSGGMLMPVSM